MRKLLFFCVVDFGCYYTVRSMRIYNEVARFSVVLCCSSLLLRDIIILEHPMYWSTYLKLGYDRFPLHLLPFIRSYIGLV